MLTEDQGSATQRHGRARAQSQKGSGIFGGCRVLAVDDHRDTVRILQRLLGSQFTLETADTCAEALRLAEQQPFHVLLSDLELPDGSGLDLMRELRTRHGTQGIAVSGHGGEAVEQSSLAAGFAEHLTKPVTYEQLYKALERLCGKRDAAA
jgi:CheY-like chemotaxis protein